MNLCLVICWCDHSDMNSISWRRLNRRKWTSNENWISYLTRRILSNQPSEFSPLAILRFRVKMRRNFILDLGHCHSMFQCTDYGLYCRDRGTTGGSGESHDSSKWMHLHYTLRAGLWNQCLIYMQHRNGDEKGAHHQSFWLSMSGWVHSSNHCIPIRHLCVKMGTWATSINPSVLWFFQCLWCADCRAFVWSGWSLSTLWYRVDEFKVNLIFASK